MLNRWIRNNRYCFLWNIGNGQYYEGVDCWKKIQAIKGRVPDKSPQAGAGDACYHEEEKIHAAGSGNQAVKPADNSSETGDDDKPDALLIRKFFKFFELLLFKYG